MGDQVNNLYREAGFCNKIFNIWAGNYVRWANKNKGIKDYSEVVFINEKDRTEILFEHFENTIQNMKSRWER